MGTYSVLGLSDANVRINGQDIPTALASSNSTAVNDLLMTCSTLFGAQLLARANLSTSALASLTSCDANAAASHCQTRIQEALKMPGSSTDGGDTEAVVTKASKEPSEDTDATAAAAKGESAGNSPVPGGETQRSGSTGVKAAVGDLLVMATAVASLPLLMAFLSA
jgi:hypothetical protein